MGVPVLDPAADIGFQLLDGVVVAALQQILGSEGEEPFDLVDPAGVGGGEVDLEAWVGGQPVLDSGSLVGAVVVADQVDGQLRWDFGVDLGEELLELDGAVPAMQAGDDGAVGDVERPNRLVVPLRT